MNSLLQAKYDLIDRMRTLSVHGPDGTTLVNFSEAHWCETGEGCGHRAIGLPFEEDFTLGVSWREAGTERLNFDVPHTLEIWVVRGRFELQLGDGPWKELRQGSTFILAPGQRHSMRCHERTYMVSAICPPLPLALPPTPTPTTC